MPNAEDMLDRDLVRALDTLDYPVAPASVEAVMVRARQRAARRRWRFVVAAGIMLAASAAAALPGSPVRRWMEAALSKTTPAVPTAPRGPNARTPSAPETRGIVTFIGDSATVVFAAAQDTGFLVIRFVPEAELRIRSADERVAYQVRPGGILVNNAGSRASYELEVSDQAALRVLMAERTLFERQGGRVTVGPAPREDGAYAIVLDTTQRR